jgi:hypothetical protein
MIEWFAANPVAMGIVTLLLMWSDWLLTVLQERERRLHYAEHYLSYPVNTIEGNPYYQKAVSEKRIIEPRHIIPALVLSALAAFALVLIPKDVRVLFIGYIWGLFLIVDTTHIGNLIGYRAGRRGLHGKLAMHLRTGYVIQMGRYLSLAGFLVVVTALSESLFMAGVAVAGLTSAVRQLVWMRKTPAIDEADAPPAFE